MPEDVSEVRSSSKRGRMTADIPETMDVLALTAPNEFEIRQADVPVPAPREVLCKVHSVAICGTDKEIISGNFLKRGWPGSYPYTPGHEWSGEVVALGAVSYTHL